MSDVNERSAAMLGSQPVADNPGWRMRMSEIEKTFRVSGEWLQRHRTMLFSRSATYGKYKRGYAFVCAMSAQVDESLGLWTVRIVMLSPHLARFVGRRRCWDFYERTDLRKMLKMLTVAHNKAAANTGG